jgi:hypothetical protein
MRTTTKTLIALTALGTSAWLLMAQDAGPQPPGNSRPPRHGAPGMNGHRPPPSPLVGVLDANHDGVIDADEIANASKALLKLDKNGDGKLTPDEFAPPPRREGNSGAGPDGPPPGEEPGQN